MEYLLYLYDTKAYLGKQAKKQLSLLLALPKTSKMTGIEDLPREIIQEIFKHLVPDMSQGDADDTKIAQYLKTTAINRALRAHALTVLSLETYNTTIIDAVRGRSNSYEGLGIQLSPTLRCKFQLRDHVYNGRYLAYFQRAEVEVAIGHKHPSHHDHPALMQCTRHRRDGVRMEVSKTIITLIKTSLRAAPVSNLKTLKINLYVSPSVCSRAPTFDQAKASLLRITRDFPTQELSIKVSKQRDKKRVVDRLEAMNRERDPREDTCELVCDLVQMEGCVVS